MGPVCAPGAARRTTPTPHAAPRHFDTLGDEWDIDTRARTALENIGLTALGLDRTIATLSGGETILTALAGLRLCGDDIVLLDEPTFQRGGISCALTFQGYQRAVTTSSSARDQYQLAA